jgi:hypothetical protein
MFYYVFRIGNDEHSDKRRFEESDKTIDDLRKFIIEDAKMDDDIEFRLSNEEYDTISIVFVAGPFNDETTANYFCQGYDEAMNDFAHKSYKHYDTFVVKTTKNIL